MSFLHEESFSGLSGRMDSLTKTGTRFSKGVNCENPVAIGVTKCPKCAGKNPVEVRITFTEKVVIGLFTTGPFWVIARFKTARQPI